MALHNIKIVVVGGGRSGSYKSKNAGIENNNSSDSSANNKDSPLYKLLNAKQTIKSKVQSGITPTSVFAMNYGTRIASQMIRQTANYYISDIGRSNGDSNYQALVNRNIEVVTDTMSIIGGTLSGAQMGSMFGPIGAGVGAVAGFVGSSLSLGFKYAQREREYQHTMFEQNTSQAYNLARANYSVWTGRVR